MYICAFLGWIRDIRLDIGVSIIAGVLSGWGIVIIDGSIREVLSKHERFELDRYRRYQVQVGKKNAISGLLNYLRGNESYDTNLLKDFKDEMETLLEMSDPYWSFKPEYLTDEMQGVINHETNLDNDIRKFVAHASPTEIVRRELQELRAAAAQAAHGFLRYKRKRVGGEVLKHILKEKRMSTALLLVITLFLLCV